MTRKHSFDHIPKHLREAHSLSNDHKEKLLESSQCACFYCMEIYPPHEITEWIDKGQTALCPKCGIDSVLGDAQITLSPEFLAQMQKQWFSITRKKRNPKP